MEEFVTCEICKANFKARITPTHLARHNITMKEYRAKFPNAILATLTNRTACAITLENQIAKYGIDEGTKRFNSYVEKQKYAGVALEYFIEKHGEVEGKLKYESINKIKCITLENQITKYGIDEGTKRFNSYVEKQKYAGVKLEYFIEKYGEVEGKLKYESINKLKKLSLENQIAKHGIDEGTKRFESFIKNYNIKTYQKFGTSILAQKVIADILSHLPKHLVDAAHHSNNEWYAYDNNHHWYFDLTFPTIKKTIEINGDYWHANPIKYLADDVLNLPHKNTKTASEIWANDKSKREAHEKQGFKILYLWENDLKLDYQLCILKAVEWITN